MLDPTVSFLIFSALIPVVMFILKIIADKYGWKPDELARQIMAGVLALIAVALQVWVIGALPEFAGDSLAILKTAVAFFSAQMTLYELIYKRIWALFG